MKFRDNFGQRKEKRQQTKRRWPGSSAKLRIGGGVFLLCLLGAAFFLPGRIIEANLDKKSGEVTAVNGDMAGKDHFVRKEALSFYDKVVLLGKSLDKDSVSAALPEEADCMSLYEASIRGREIIDELYAAGDYPENIDSGFKNWYSYSGTLYAYTEHYFDTYSCYVWALEYQLYDRTVMHTIYVDAQTGEWYFLEMTGSCQEGFENKTKEIVTDSRHSLYQVFEADKDEHVYRIYFSETSEESRRWTEDKDNAVSENLSSMVDAPKTDSFSVAVDGRTVLDINAEIVLPDVDGMDVTGVKFTQYAESDIEKIYQICATESCELNPPDLVERSVNRAKEEVTLSENDSDYPGVREDVWNNELFMSMADTGIFNEKAFKFTEVERMDGKNVNLYLGLMKDGIQEGYLRVTDTGICFSWDADNWIMAGGGMLGFLDMSNDRTRQYISSESVNMDEENLEIPMRDCRALIESMDLWDYTLNYAYIIPASYAANAGKMSWGAWFEKRYDGVCISDFSISGYELPINRIEISFTDGLLDKLKICNALNFMENNISNVELLSYDQIKEIVCEGEYLNKEYIRTIEDTNFRSFPVDHIALEYALVRDENAQWMLVPAWNFYMFNESYNEYVNWLSVNAIDGSCIDCYAVMYDR